MSATCCASAGKSSVVSRWRAVYSASDRMTSSPRSHGPREKGSKLGGEAVLAWSGGLKSLRWSLHGLTQQQYSSSPPATALSLPTCISLDKARLPLVSSVTGDDCDSPTWSPSGCGVRYWLPLWLSSTKMAGSRRSASCLSVPCVTRSLLQRRV